MGREVWRMDKGFRAPLGVTWWGLVLPPIPCQSCTEDTADDCPVCEGEGRVWPEVQPPGWPVAKAPSYVDADWMDGRYGWQLWETTTEGSPISPVCESPEALARWLADNDASSFGRRTESYETWLAFVRGPGWAMTFMVHDGAVESGVAFAATPKEDDHGETDS